MRLAWCTSGGRLAGTTIRLAASDAIAGAQQLLADAEAFIDANDVPGPQAAIDQLRATEAAGEAQLTADAEDQEQDLEDAYDDGDVDGGDAQAYYDYAVALEAEAEAEVQALIDQITALTAAAPTANPDDLEAAAEAAEDAAEADYDVAEDIDDGDDSDLDDDFEDAQEEEAEAADTAAVAGDAAA
eukprot:5593155-Pyramimonas_sp.AAC.1